MVEIYDTDKGTIGVTAPIPIDPATMKPRADKDPRTKKTR
jgi:hypothetical protein